MVLLQPRDWKIVREIEFVPGAVFSLFTYFHKLLQNCVAVVGKPEEIGLGLHAQLPSSDLWLTSGIISMVR